MPPLLHPLSCTDSPTGQADPVTSSDVDDEATVGSSDDGMTGEADLETSSDDEDDGDFERQPW